MPERGHGAEGAEHERRRDPSVGMIPAARTIVPASMVSLSSRTRPASIDWTAGCQPRAAGARQKPRAGLEQPKTNLVAPDAWIEAQHVAGKRRELTHQFDAD